MLIPPTHSPIVTRRIDARVVWMGNEPLNTRKQYKVRHTTQVVKAQVRLIRYRLDINTLSKGEASELKLNEVGAVVIDTQLPLFVDPYLRNRATGSFVLIDPLSNATVAAGMITGRDPERTDDPFGADVDAAGGGHVSAAEREARIGHPAVLIWIKDGLPAAHILERELFNRGYLTHVLDAPADRALLVPLLQSALAAGLVVICAAEFLYDAEREKAKALIPADRFLELDALGAGTPEQAGVQLCQMLADRSIVPVRRT